MPFALAFITEGLILFYRMTYGHTMAFRRDFKKGQFSMSYYYTIFEHRRGDINLLEYRSRHSHATNCAIGIFV